MGKNIKSIDYVRCGPPPRFPRMCGTSLKTINNIIHKDLELDTRRKGKVHKLTPFHMKNRATNARKLYEEHLAGSRSEYTATLDEAWMYVTYCNGIRKICYIKRGNQVPDNWVHQCSETFPKGFMVVGVMTGRGVLPLIKVPSKVKVNSEFYIECVLKPVIEQLKDLYPGEMDKVFLHHDKASSHTSNKTQQFLQEMKDTLGLNFIRNSDIPVKSPDASPLDFYGFDIQNIFTANGKSCRDFDLPVPPDVSDFSVSTYNAEAEKNKADEMRKKFDQNAKQKLAFEAIMSTIDDNSLPQRLFFLDGPGGSGKTFLYKTLLSTIRGNNGIALPVASTGIAANLLEGERTYHSQFKLPVPLLDTSTSSMRMTSDDAKQIREANVIIYDEATMAPKDALRCINNLFKEIMQNKKPLGGKTIVFGGDFRQTLPVVPHGTQAAIVESSIKYHPLWKKFNILKLDNNIRSIDPEFSAWLLKLGNGELTNDLGLDSETFEIPSEMVCNGDLVKEIYGDKLLPSDFEQYTDKAILCPRNVDVDDINNRVLDILEDSFQEKPPKKTTAIFLDMSSAFDRVWREKLREKLHNIRTYSLESRRQNKNNLDRHFGNEEPEDEISLTTCGLVDPPFSENEVKLTAFKFGKRKSPGPEGIDNTVVKALVRMHPSLLSRLFKRCLDTVCLGMVLDSLLAQRLKHWLVSNELLSSFQHGFREGKSTTTALNEVLEGVEMGLNKGAWVLFVALDIDGAFNSMNWNKLMRNLMDMGCPDNLCSLVRDLLRDRRISLSFGGRKLEKNCARGCPQGSCCGPILWNILVNTVFQEELPEGARLVLYADDQFLIIEAASRAKAEKCGETSLQILSNWAYDSGLKFNVSKTKALSFKPRDIRNKRKGIKWEHKPAIRIEGRRGLVSPKQGSEGGDYSRESAEESGTQNHRGITHYQQTISRRLVANGLHSCRPLRRLPLTPPNRRQRLEWCRARSTWMTEWHRVVFSDESRFCLSSDSRRVRVWRRRGERSNPAAIVERPTVRQRGIMVWGAIAYDSRSPLLRIQGTMTAHRYVDDVLRPVTLPYLQRVPNALYQQDNARPHTARISQQALQDVQMLPWPPYSPDLSPIEHVWDIIGRRLHALPQPRSEDELWQMVEREWRAIPQDAIRTLIDSLPRRVAACIDVRGGPTCY
ncbi:hypothetical protein LAZ67_3001100 [Cordylochernes scorpioides]|uniref:ATP-dependent DNA helicase n=1 Tax=Cordylochernes scorpioides TaxID=51811 RepID=A0ABY6K6L7_9ARAC|nr:hypothetical protein LAZ67_3001100 [Cordylochernes scorpioides]